MTLSSIFRSFARVGDTRLGKPFHTGRAARRTWGTAGGQERLGGHRRLHVASDGHGHRRVCRISRLREFVGDVEREEILN